MLVYFMVIWYILWSFGIFCGHLVYFMAIWYIPIFPFWYVVPRKIWSPCSELCFLNVVFVVAVFCLLRAALRGQQKAEILAGVSRRLPLEDLVALGEFQLGTGGGRHARTLASRFQPGQGPML
jgi:hypothetical protein